MTMIDELSKTIEEIRAEKYSDIPANLVAKVIDIERDFTDNRSEAVKRIKVAIQGYLQQEAGTDA